MFWNIILKVLSKVWLFINNIFRSLDNIQNSGYSARKLTGLACVLMGSYITKYKLPQDAQLHALYAWLVAALIALGIITMEHVIKLRAENKTKEL